MIRLLPNPHYFFSLPHKAAVGQPGPDPTVVSGRACLPPHDKYGFCDLTKSVDARVDDLISRCRK